MFAGQDAGLGSAAMTRAVAAGHPGAQPHGAALSGHCVFPEADGGLTATGRPPPRPGPALCATQRQIVLRPGAPLGAFAPFMAS